MPATVVDASVVAALVFSEPRADEASLLLAGGELYAPTLLGYEMANVALQKSRRSPAMAEAYTIALDRVFRMGIRFLDVPYQEVYDLARETLLSAYDASYVYVARSRGMPLLTFDRRLQEAAGGL